MLAVQALALLAPVALISAAPTSLLDRRDGHKTRIIKTDGAEWPYYTVDDGATCWESSNVGRTEGLTPDKWDIVKVYGDFRKFYWNGKKDAETQPGDLVATIDSGTPEVHIRCYHPDPAKIIDPPTEGCDWTWQVPHAAGSSNEAASGTVIAECSW